MANGSQQVRLIRSLTDEAALLIRSTQAPAIIALFLGGLIYPDTARADYVKPHAEVVCQKGVNAALIRFTLTANEDPIAYRQLPAHIDNGLSGTRTLGRANCGMANGWIIRIRHGEKQPFAYGMGGADPAAFFSLWVAQRKILSRKEWKPGQETDYRDHGSPWLIGIVIRPDRPTYCYVAGGVDAPEKGNISCRDEAFSLSRYKVDRIEYAPPPRQPSGGRYHPSGARIGNAHHLPKISAPEARRYRF